MEEWLTLEEASRLLKLKVDTLRKWLAAGKLKGRKLGRRWLVHVSEIQRLLPPPEPEEPQAPPRHSS
jgi:excisionase family DNA binding protein